MTEFDYTAPVSDLLTLGDCREMRIWPDYLAMGIDSEHIPDLIRMVEDDELNRAHSDSLEVWAPAHAWRALGQLRAEAAVEPLIRLLYRIDEFHDDWVGEEVPDVFGMIGSAAIPALTDYLMELAHGLWARAAAAHGLAEIGKRHPEARDDCVAALTQVLEGFADHDPTLNGLVISFLVDLKGIEAAPVMERAFAADCVDISILGDWEDAQIELGLLAGRQTPPPQYIWAPDVPGPSSQQPSPSTTDQQLAQQRQTERRRKAERKIKRKQQKRARRKQRKRK
jgi:hypothetical protein